MLKGEPEEINLKEWRDKLIFELRQELQSFEFTLLDHEVVKFKYPIQSYPEKISSFNLEKSPEITGKLLGIKGQYLIFDSGVFNVRAHTGYEVELEEVHANT